MSNATQPPAKIPPAALPGDESTARAPGSKPVLLEQLPPSLFASPGFIVGIVAVEFLYALVLFAVVSSIKSERLLTWGPEPPPVVPRIEPAFVPRVTSTVAARDSKAQPSRDKPSASGVKVSEPEKSKPTASPTNPVVAQNKEKPAPKRKRPARRKKQTSKKKQDAEVALNTKPAEPPPPPKPIPTIPPLGMLIDPLHASGVATDAEGLTIKVAKGLFIFDARSKIETAPRALTSVEGDFIAEVSIPGTMRSPTEPLKGLRMTFQGAGLLLWQDNENYIRFERTAAYTGERLHKVMAESCKDGKQTKTEFRNVREGTIRLRMERRDSRLMYAYTLDGKTWLKLPASMISLPARVEIGISASNASPKDFSARFENFELKTN